MTSHDDLSCPFRGDVHVDGESETAICNFLSRLTGAPRSFCRVDRSACEICLRHSPLSPSHLNPVIPSLILGVCESAYPDAEEDSPEGALQSWARDSVATEGAAILAPQIHGCDCIVFCDQGRSLTRIETMIAALVSQTSVQSIIHLVVRDRSQCFIDLSASHPNVRLHRIDAYETQGECLNRIASQMVTQWLAILPSQATPTSTWLKTTIEEMEIAAAEIHVSTLGDGRNGETTFVARRGTVVDLDGFDTESNCCITEFYNRVRDAGREFIIADWIPDESLDRRDRTRSSHALPRQARSSHALPRAGMSLSELPRPCCDVVLPFRDSLDLVRQALEGLLSQETADVVIHLIDDQSRQDIGEFFAEYCDRPNIRFYRNRKNIGPFASFNNIALIAENDWIAVQDGDDISLPNRIGRSCRLLQAADADILGARTELFGEPDLVQKIAHESIELPDGSIKHVRNSRYPKRNLSGYFLENPSLVMRTRAFKSLGGYGDFGSGKRSRTGVDTDFQVRAFYARASIIVTQDILVRYRCHGASAVNHAETGFGSLANAESHAEVRRRFFRYCSGTFDPRWFGSLGQHQGITVRIDP